jgi:hypothetical protein
MARPPKRYRIRVRGHQRTDIDPDLLMQALLLMAEEHQQTANTSPQPRSGGVRPMEEPA